MVTEPPAVPQMGLRKVSQNQKGHWHAGCSLSMRRTTHRPDAESGSALASPHNLPQGGAFGFLRPCGRLAPDSHVHGRMLLPGQRPHLFFICFPAPVATSAVGRPPAGAPDGPRQKARRRPLTVGQQVRYFEGFSPGAGMALRWVTASAGPAALAPGQVAGGNAGGTTGCGATNVGASNTGQPPAGSPRLRSHDRAVRVPFATAGPVGGADGSWPADW